MNGINTVPIYQFLNMLKNLMLRFKPHEVMLTWDKRLSVGTNFRKELVPYKEQRTNVEEHDIIHDYIRHLQTITDSLGIQTIYPNLFEADDVIRFVTELDDETNVIVSSDKDLLQLINDKTVVFLPSKNIVVNLENFEEHIGVKPEQFVLYKAILGDVSDNVPGLDKYGPVRARKLSEKIYNAGFNDRDVLFAPTVNAGFNEQDFDLSLAQLNIIQRNLQIMDLKYPHRELVHENSQYHKQCDLRKTYFDTDKFRTLCYTYNLLPFIREMGIWRQYFDKKNFGKSSYDLLSTISM